MTKAFLRESHQTLALQTHGWSSASYAAGSDVYVEWIRSKGHLCIVRIINRTARHSGCPECAGKEVLTGLNDLKTLASGSYTQQLVYWTRNGIP